MRATNRTRNTILVDRGEIAASVWARMRGLIGRESLEAGQGLLLKGEKAIHSFGMRFAFDALFLDRQGRVVYILISMPPLRASPLVWKAQDVLEVPAGKIAETGTALGDLIEIQPS